MNTLLADRIIKTFKSLNLKPSSLHEPTFKGLINMKCSRHYYHKCKYLRKKNKK